MIKKYRGAGGDIVLPTEAVVGGKTVKVDVVRYNAFKNDNPEAKGNITSLDVPVGYIEINQYAFANQNEMTKVTLPDSIMLFGNAFSGCRKLQTVGFHAADPVLDMKGCGTGQFSKCDELEPFHFKNKKGEPVDVITSDAYFSYFEGCEKFVNVDKWIEEWVKEIKGIKDPEERVERITHIYSHQYSGVPAYSEALDKMATKLIRSEAAAGNEYAKFVMVKEYFGAGYTIFEGQTPPTSQEVLRILKGWAAKGNTDGYYNLGRMYEAGDGVPKNLNTALQWYAKGKLKGDDCCDRAYWNLKYRMMR